MELKRIRFLPHILTDLVAFLKKPYQVNERSYVVRRRERRDRKGEKKKHFCLINLQMKKFTSHCSDN